VEERMRHCEPGKGLKRRRALTPGISDIERLDALMRSVYGRTLHQFLNQFLTDAFQLGYKEGIKAGKRLAKGKPEFPTTGPGFLKSRGAPKLLDGELLRRQFIEFVDDHMHETGVSLPVAVSKYRDVMKRAWKGLDTSEVPNQEQLLRLYKRDKRATRLKR
jgi:hypothetical protein